MRWIALASVLCVATAIALAGWTPLGRIALALRMPGIAAEIFDEPSWTGVAHFRSGAFADAAQAFNASDMAFNRGNALARQGRYAAALEA